MIVNLREGSFEALVLCFKIPRPAGELVPAWVFIVGLNNCPAPTNKLFPPAAAQHTVHSTAGTQPPHYTAQTILIPTPGP